MPNKITHRLCSQMFLVKGVTVVELLVVIFIIGVLVAYLVPTSVNRALRNARIAETKQKLEQLRKAIVGNPDLITSGEYVDNGFKGDVGRYPRNFLELVTKPADCDSWNPFTKHGWNGPYVRDDGKQSFMFDAWGDSIKYLLNDLGDTIGLQSRGPDGEWFGTNPYLKNDDIQIIF